MHSLDQHAQDYVEGRSDILSHPVLLKQEMEQRWSRLWRYTERMYPEDTA